VSVNTDTCGLEGSYVSTGSYFYTYSSMNGIFVASIIVLNGASVLLIGSVYLFQSSWEVLLRVSFLFQFFGGILGVALAYVTAAAVSAATYQENNNIGQNVYVNVGLITAVMMSVIELMLSNTVSIWRA
jgi:hypothetical protein